MKKKGLTVTQILAYAALFVAGIFALKEFAIVVKWYEYVALYVASVFIVKELYTSFRSCVLIKKQDAFLKKIEWKIFEIRIPQTNAKTPKAMEQVFMSLHSLYAGKIKFKDRWIKGRVDSSFSCELVGFAGSMHLFVRVPAPAKNLLEAAVFAVYPEAEITETEDYVTRFGDNLPNDEFDIYGGDFTLDKKNPYPIRTYADFDVDAKDEEHRMDPIAILAETMAGLQADEMMWVQLNLAPADGEWKKELTDAIDEIKGKKEDKSKLWENIFEFIGNLFIAFKEVPTWKSGEKKELPEIGKLSPGARDRIKDVENKVAKLGFNAIVRFMYLDKKDAFTESNIAAFKGALRQFGSMGHNEFKETDETATKPSKVGLFFKARRVVERKKQFFKTYCERQMPLDPERGDRLKLKSSVLNTEELATLFHPPHMNVAARTISRTETKKASAPANLPVL